MMVWDQDPWAEQEALDNERAEADREQYEMTQAGNAIARAERAGICTHGSVAGYLPEPVYPEQEGLSPGQLACTKHTAGCVAVFDSDEDWHAAMAAAVRG